jgi:formate hydrogenlyase subunit 6/NADH:ubiquinone oxidoreductase subunit I
MESHCVYKSDDCKICKKVIPMNQPTWEEEFDKNLQWVEIDGLQIKFVTMKNTYIDLKSFVRKTLSQQRKEIERTIETFYQESPHHMNSDCCAKCEEVCISNYLLDNIITKLSEEK